MRITTEAKVATRERIVEVAAELFAKNGWEGTTTRDITTAAGIATGTFFNYFQSKEAVAAALISESLTRAQRRFESRREEGQTVEEELFAFVWMGLKSLRALRHVMASALETIFSPLARSSQESAGDSIRVNHLELVEQILADHGITAPLPPLTMQIYWTLYLGVFAYWAADTSPHQEDSMALLDQSLKLFIASFSGLRKGGNRGRKTE